MTSFPRALRALPFALVLANAAPAATIFVDGLDGAAGALGESGDPGQPGLDGVAGEFAIAIAAGEGPYNLANVSGGAGGKGGRGGDGIPLGAHGGVGGSGAAGGDAEASAITSDARDAEARAVATGGPGGDFGAGGQATEGGVSGASGSGGAGGNASAVAHAHSSMGDATAVARGYGGQGGRGVSGGPPGGPAGSGGSATARASATADSGGAASATAFQVGGSGGYGPPVGGSAGASSELIDAVSGSTSGELTLSQRAWGGSSHGGPTGVGGDARSILSATNPGGGSLRIEVDASAGSGDARGGDARVGASGVDTTGAELGIFATARGGSAAEAFGRGGAAVLETLHGVSTAGGKVSVSGSAFGGYGNVGADVELVDAVSGETSGELYLDQYADGGSGVSTPGVASSRIHRTGSFASLGLGAGAQGGNAGRSGGGVPNPVSGAAAIADVGAENDAGSVGATASANGGGGATTSSGAVGGAAGGVGTSTARARSVGNQHHVAASASASGGAGGNLASFADLAAGRGGDGHARSFGEAADDSAVQVVATAQGGPGGGIQHYPWQTSPGGRGAGGDGGDALAEAFAAGAGPSPVLAYASAEGGRAGVGSDGSSASSAGSATSVARAVGMREVSSIALAYGPGSRSATSSSTASGDVRSVDISIESGMPGSGIPAPSSSSLPNELRAWSGLGNAAPGLPGGCCLYPSDPFGRGEIPTLQAVLGIGNPLESDVVEWVAGTTRVRDALADTGRVLAMGELSSYSEAIGLEAGSIRFEIESAAIGYGEDLALAFLEAEVSGAGFDVLHLALELDGNAVFERHFVDPGAAAEELDDRVVALALSEYFASETIDILIRFQLGIRAGTSYFQSRFALIAIPVPEPALASGLLLAFVGVAGARLRGRR